MNDNVPGALTLHFHLQRANRCLRSCFSLENTTSFYVVVKKHHPIWLETIARWIPHKKWLHKWVSGSVKIYKIVETVMTETIAMPHLAWQHKTKTVKWKLTFRWQDNSNQSDAKAFIFKGMFDKASQHVFDRPSDGIAFTSTRTIIHSSCLWLHHLILPNADSK